MLRNKIKLSFIAFVVIMLISNLCFATDVMNLTNSEEDIMLISEDEETTSTDTTQTQQDETVNTDIYRIGDSVEITELIDGNAFVISANEFKLTGQIGGDLFVIADKVSIEGGAVYGNVFVMAKEVNITGMIYDLYCITNTLNIGYDGVAYRDIRATAQTVDFSGVVSRSMYLSANEINLRADTYIGSNLEYESSKEANIEEGAQILGETKFNQSQTTTKNVWQLGVEYILDVINILVYTLIIWLLIRAISPKFIEKSGELVRKRGIVSILIGLLIMVVIPIIFILTAVVGDSLIGVGLLVFGLYIMIIAISQVVAVIAISQLFKAKWNFLSKAKESTQDLLYIIIITIALTVISLIPILGAIVNLLVILLGMGIFVINIFGKEKKTEIVNPTVEE